MDNIINIPEGATHYSPKTGSIWMYVGGIWYYWMKEEQEWFEMYEKEVKHIEKKVLTNDHKAV